MKNLKKVLSLALALVMAMSLMTTAFAADASDFADYDKVTNTEAMDVMVAVGVFEGADGKLDPTGELTREQAAKIVTYMLLGKDQADKLTTTNAPYADVAATRWSAGAIAYCTSEGILAGSNGKFNPTDKLTGQQFAKMLLCALGYDAEQEGLIGGSWAIKASTLATKLGLDKNLDILLSANLTREQAAQMALNALQATCVEYVGGTNITIGDTTITQGATRRNIDASAAAYTNYNNCIVTASSSAATLELGEQLYKGKLAYAYTGTTDDYGRAVGTWAYNAKATAQGTTASPANAAQVIAKGLTASAAYTYTVKADVAATGTDSIAEVETMINNALKLTGGNALTVKAAATAYVQGASQTIAGTGFALKAGDTVEVFTARDGEVNNIVVLRQSAYYVEKVAANTAKLKTSTYVDANGNAVVYENKITLKDVNDANAVITNELDMPGYTADVVKGAYVLSDGQTYKVVEPVNGAIAGYDNTAKTVTIAGTTYNMAGAGVYQDDLGGGVPDFKTGNYNAILNDAGYVVAIDTVQAAAATLDDVVYTNGTVWTDTSTKYGVTTTNVYTQIIDLKGTVTDLEIARYTYNGTTYTQVFDDSNVLAFGAAGITAGSEAAVKNAAKVATTGAAVYVNDSAKGLDSISENVYNIASVAATSTVPAHQKLVAFSVANLSADTDATVTDAFTAKTTKYDSKYITANTTSLLISGSGSTTKAKVLTGPISYTANNETVINIYSTINNELKAMIFTSSSMTMTDTEVLYVVSTSTNVNGSGTRLHNDVYKLDGTKMDAMTVASGYDTDKFVTFTQNADTGVYSFASAGSTFDASLNVDWTTSLTPDGKYLEGTKLVKNSFYADRINVNSNNGDDRTLADIPAADVVVVDVRAESDVYAGSFTSLDDIVTALTTARVGDTTYYNKVVADVYVDASGVATIFVTETAQGDIIS